MRITVPVSVGPAVERVRFYDIGLYSHLKSNYLETTKNDKDPIRQGKF